MKDIAKEILTIKAFEINEAGFNWASGIKSPFYCDNRKILSYPGLWKKIIDKFCEKLNDYQFDGVAGVATAGIAHASAISYQMNKPLVYVRSKAKGHGQKNLIEGELSQIQSVVVIEDLFSTGSSALKAVKALEEQGKDVLSICSIFSYDLKKLKDNFRAYNYFSLLTVDDMISISNLSESEKKVVQDFLTEHR